MDAMFIGKLMELVEGNAKNQGKIQQLEIGLNRLSESFDDITEGFQEMKENHHEQNGRWNAMSDYLKTQEGVQVNTTVVGDVAGDASAGDMSKDGK